MKLLLRNMIALLGGAIVAIVLIGLVQAAAHAVYPPPAGLDYNDPAVLRAIMMNAPAGALLMVLLSYLAGAFAGAWVTTSLSVPNGPIQQGYLVGGLLLVGSVMNLKEIPHPVWFMVGNIVAILAGAYLGTKVGLKKAVTAPQA